MRPVLLLSIAIWVGFTCAGCGPAQAQPGPDAVIAVTAEPSSTVEPAAATVPASTPTPGFTATATRPPLPSLTPTALPPAAGFLVDPAVEQGAISPLVYGSNYGPWLFVTLDNMDEMKASGLTYMRWPGGNWGDLNDIDAYQMDTFLSFCENYHLEPAISVRLRGGTVERAVALVKYVKERGNKVKYWSIGNEPTLYKDYDTVRYNQEWRQFALAMRAANPDILLLGPEPHQYSANLASNPKDKQGRDWVEEFLKANGDLVDIVAIHRYPFPASPNSPAPVKSDLRANSPEWDQIIPTLRAQIRQFTGRDLPVAVTEVNSSWAANRGGEATMESHYNAIWWGDALGRMIRQGVDIVAQFDVVGDYGLMDKYDPYPIYFVYQMYQKFGVRRLAAGSADADISIFAARREDGALTVMLVNRASEPRQMPLQIQGLAQSTPSETWLFDPAHKAEAVSTAEVFDGGVVKLPGESMVLYVFP